MDIEKAAADYGARDAAILPLPSLSLSSKPRNKISKALKYTSKLVYTGMQYILRQPIPCRLFAAETGSRGY